MNLQESNQKVTFQSIIGKYSIVEQDKDEFKTYLLNRNLSELLEFVSKKKRSDLAKDIKTYYKILDEGKKTEERHAREQFFKSMFIKYQIDDEDIQEINDQINENNFELFVECAKKKHRENMRKQITQYFEKQKRQQNQNNQNLSEAKFNDEVFQLFSQFEIEKDEFQDCLKSLNQNDINGCVDYVKKKKRGQFKSAIEKLLEKFRKVIILNANPKLSPLKMQNQLKNQNQSKDYQIITIKFGEIMKDVRISGGVQEFGKILKIKFDILSLDQFTITMDGEEINSLQEIFKNNKKQILLKFVRKICIEYQFLSKSSFIWISESATQNDIKILIQKNLINQNMIKEEEIFIQFLDSKGKEKTFQILKNFIKQQGKNPNIRVGTVIYVYIYYQQQQKIYKMKSYNNIHDLQLQIQKDFIPIESQTLQIQKENGKVYIKQSDEETSLDQFATANILQLTLTNHHTTQFYGFHENVQQTFNKFFQFSIQRDEDFIEIINLCDFCQQNQQRAFQNSFLKYLNSCIKKKFPIEVIIEKVKQLVIKNKFQNIWTPNEPQKHKTMNQSFLLMYLLRNSQSRLKVQIMNLVKNLMPLPLFIKQFPHIFSKSQKISLNKQIIWAMQPGITICSIGIHTANNAQQKGKTEFINNIFFTNFCLKDNKHQIVKKIPYIAIKIYDDLFPVNIIDIPFDCDQSIKQQLIESSDIVFLHSWKDEKQTVIQMEKIAHNKLCISFLRDSKQTTREFLKNLNQVRFQSKKLIKIPNLANTQANKGSVDIIRSKINLFILQQKRSIYKSTKIFSFLKDPEFQNLNKTLELLNNKGNICQFAQYSAIITSQISNQKQKIKIEELNKKTLHPSINGFLNFITKTKIPLDILLMHFRQKLRSIQTQNITRYMIIYKIKEKLEKCLEKTPGNYSQEIIKAEEILTQLKLSSSQRSLVNKKPEQVGKIIDIITSDFENNIKPKIFSIQLFWRQINAFLKIHPDYKVNNQCLFDITRTLKSKQVMSNQPFQIIDGDCLQMPKNMMRKVFENFGGQKCIVLTIIGPQSSGKSTLLNFLFGCDFSTSEGRCTRGVYGTYFKINDTKIKNFEGIFVIDTEGLFALTNQTDEKHQDRQNFDSKLVLFCLAVSDFVIINVRGNLDKNTQKILSLCNEKLEALDLNEEQRPQIVIVLNQNNTSKTQQSQNQFKKIRKTFNFNLSRSLSLAYSIKNYGKNEISLLGQNQILTKKVPFTQFHIQTTNLLCEIVQKMKKKRNVETIMIKLDKFSQIWSTVLTFPNLSQMTTKQHRKLESEIKAWKKQREQQVNSEISNILMSYINQKIDEGIATRSIQQLNSKYFTDFEKQYQKQALNQQLKALYENQKKQITLKNDNNYLKLKYEIMKSNMQKQLIKEKFQGDGILREYEKDIIKNQNSGVKYYTEEQKKQIFEKGFNSALDKISKTMKLSDKPHVQLERIKADYDYHIKSGKSQLQKYGLPRDQLNYNNFDINKIDYSGLKKKLLSQLLNHGFRQPQNFMVYTQRPYTNVLVGSLSDAKLKYFNMKEYFKKQKQTKRYFISKSSLIQAFNDRQFSNKIRRIIEDKKKKRKERSYLKQIFKNINQYLQQIGGIQISSFDDFENILEQESSNFFGKIVDSISNYIFRQPKIQIKYISGKANKKQENQQQQFLWKKVHRYVSFYEDDFYVEVNTNFTNKSCNDWQSGKPYNYYSNYPKYYHQSPLYSYNQNGINYYQSGQNNYHIYSYPKHTGMSASNQDYSQRKQDNKIENDINEAKNNKNYEKNKGKKNQIEERSKHQKIEEKKKQKKQKKAIENMLKQKINWKQIQKQLQNNKTAEQDKIIIDEINIEIIQLLNEDLKFINLNLTKIPYALTKYDVWKPQNLFKQIDVMQSNYLIKDQNQFLNQSANFRFFSNKKIKQQIKTKAYSQRQKYFQIARYEYDILVPTQKYFKGYQDSDNKQMKKRFQDRQFKQFIFKQIKQEKKTLNLLFEEICKIVDNSYQKWRKFQTKAIGSVFTEVNQEITQFNNDLNQISHQLHHVAVGSIHVFAIYLMWKLQIDNIFKKNNQPYEKKLANKIVEYQRFLMRTSNDLNKIVRNEVEEFFEKIKQSFEQYINDVKAQEQNQTIKNFNMKVKRQLIQRQVDIQIFTSNTNPQIILQYLQKPYDFISSKYEQNYAQYFENSTREMKKNKYSQRFCNQILDCINQMNHIFLEIQKITQQKGNPIDLFEMVTKNSQKIDYDEEAKNTLFQYFCDRITGDNQDAQRNCSDIKVKLRRALTKNKPNKGFVRQIIQGVKNKNLKITNIIKFLNLSSQEHLLSQLKCKLGQIQLFSSQQQQQFKNKIRIVICKQKCPCCGKICGLQGMHSYHQCLYGHQMRALAGNHIEKNGKKEAYVVRCQMLKQNDLMFYNGNKYTWTQFKQYWRTKPTGGWIYDDLKEVLKQEDKKRCINAWLQAGPLFCEKMGIQYVDYNDAQNQLKLNGAMHIIFALDESGSMSGSWQGLLKTLKQIQIKISKFQSQGNQVYISIINFQSSARIIHKRCKPLQFDVLKVPFSSGGTCFESAFNTTYKLANQFIHQQQILFIFMTDGGDSYPSSSIQLLKGLMKNYPNKLIYSGIQFGNSCRVMQLIAKELNGNNIRAGNFEELLKAYSSCLEIIAYEENPTHEKQK